MTHRVAIKKIAELACLSTTPENEQTFQNDLGQILEFMDELKAVDTKNISPMFHPLDEIQRLRSDIASDADVCQALEKVAPEFTEHLYWVPKVIETEK